MQKSRNPEVWREAGVFWAMIHFWVRGPTKLLSRLVAGKKMRLKEIVIRGEIQKSRSQKSRLAVKGCLESRNPEIQKSRNQRPRKPEQI